jgi:hypothetical protein
MHCDRWRCAAAAAAANQWCILSDELSVWVAHAVAPAPDLNNLHIGHITYACRFRRTCGVRFYTKFKGSGAYTVPQRSVMLATSGAQHERKLLIRFCNKTHQSVTECASAQLLD